jgi:AraC-like DNA-binding protein
MHILKEPGYIDAQNFGVDEPFYVDELTLHRAFPLHRHSFAEFEYLVDGEGSDIINGIEYELKKGSISFKLPWHAHELMPASGSGLHIYKCSFRLNFSGDGGLLQNLNDLALQCFDYPPVTHIPDDVQPRVEQLFTDLLTEKKSIRPWKDELSSTKISELLILFLRSVMDAEIEQTDMVPVPQKFNVWDAVKLVNSRFREKDISINDLAEALSCTEDDLDEQLKAQVGLNFSELLQEARIRNTCNLLMYTSAPIESISGWAGFRSRNTFYDAFENLKGTSPSNFRKQFLDADKEQLLPSSFTKTYSRVVYYLHALYGDDLSLENVAQVFHYNPVYFSNMLSSNGTTFTDLLSEIRIYNACKLLLISDLSTTAIAQRVGFQSPETFFRAFKKLRNCTPNAYRAKKKRS